MRQAIANGMFRELMTEVTAQELQTNGAEMIHDHEFRMNGFKYDIVEEYEHDGHISYLVIRDDNEKEAEKTVERWHQKKDNKNVDDNTNFLQKHLSKYLKYEALLIPFVGFNKRKVSFELSCDYIFFRMLSGPPPKAEYCN